MVHNTVCLYKTDDSNWCGKMCEVTTFKKLLQNIKDNGYSLPTQREWEYLSGKGGVELFSPWGNNIDFSMNLKHMEWMDNDGEYTLERKTFGLIIGDDPYCREIVYDDEGFSYKGGDGGRNICGDQVLFGVIFPVSPYFKDKELSIGDYINGGYDFFGGGIIRIDDR